MAEKWGEKWGARFGCRDATVGSSMVRHFSLMIWLDVSDVLCRYSLGANPRGVTDSVVRFSTYVGFSIFALLLLMHYT